MWRFGLFSRVARRGRVAVAVAAALACGAVAGVVTNAPMARAAEVKPAAGDRVALAQRMEQLYQGLEAAQRDLPRDSFDPRAVVELVGRDPQKLAAWVRESTWHVPYRGALRGPVGVLQDRQGNSLDRSLLLASVLKGAGFQSRLARAELSAEQAKALLAAAKAPAKDRLAQPAQPSPEAQAAKYGLTAEQYRQTSEEVLARSGKTAEDVMQVVAEQGPKLAEAVGKPAAAAGDGGIEATRDHWWVQAEVGGAWVDFDPTTADGKPAVAAAKTIPFDDKGGTALPALEPADVHQVRLTVVVEKLDGTTLTEAPVLKHAVNAAEVHGTTMTLTNLPVRFPSAIDPSTKAGGEQLKKAALATKAWVPILTIGKQQVTSFGFDQFGDVTEKPTLDPAQMMGNATGGLMGGLGGGLTGGGGAKEKKTQLTAVWVDFEIVVPGQPVRKVRREVFDALGPATRGAGGKLAAAAAPLTEAQRVARGLALIAFTDVLAQSCDLSPTYVSYRAGEAMLAARSAWTEAAKQTRSDRRAVLNRFVGKERAPGIVVAVALGRRQFSPRAADTYFDRPNVLQFRRSFVAKPDGSIVQADLVDVATNEIAVRPGVADAFAAQLEQGVADTAAERFALGADKVENTTALFAAAAAQGIGAATVRAAGDPALKAIEMPADVRARVEATLAQGYAVVMPAKPVALAGGPRTGWWRVDPKTGGSLGIMDTGYHATAAERAAAQTMVDSMTAHLGYPVTATEFATESSTTVYYMLYGANAPMNTTLLVQIANCQMRLAMFLL